MKFYQLIFLAMLAACSPKSTTNENVIDSTKTVAQDSVVAQPMDSAAVEEPKQTPPIADIKPEAKDPSKKTLKCKFQSIEEGDCLHIIFDCADLGTAETASLSADQLKLWKDLISFEGHGDYPGANPKYVGKTFEVIHNSKEGYTCEPGPNGEGVKGQVPNLLSFKLIAN